MPCYYISAAFDTKKYTTAFYSFGLAVGLIQSKKTAAVKSSKAKFRNYSQLQSLQLKIKIFQSEHDHGVVLCALLLLKIECVLFGSKRATAYFS